MAKALAKQCLASKFKIVHKLKGVVTVIDIDFFRRQEGFADKIFLERWSPSFYRGYIE